MLDLLLEAEGVDDNAAYRFDVMNVTRQALGNEFNHTRDRFTQAYVDGNIEAAKAEAKRLDDIIVDLDMLLSTDPQFSLSQWIADARRHGRTPAEADAYEENARTILSIWGYTDKKLNDYANRQWSGLLNSFYRTRWNMFTSAVIEAMENGRDFDKEATTEAIKAWEGQWAQSKAAETPVVRNSPVELARKYRDKYLR